MKPVYVTFIYALSDPRTNAIRYVGKTDDIKSRRSGHLTEKGDTYKARWIKQLKAAGLEPVMDVLEILAGPDVHHWHEQERWWIAYLKFLGCRLTNSTTGGRHGGKLSIETRQKMSVSQKGRKFSFETRMKISAALKGVPLSIEHRSNIGAARKGRKLSDKTKAKMSASRTGRTRKPFTAEHKANLSRAIRAAKNHNK